MLDKHLTLIAQAARRNTQILRLQELFYGPHVCAKQNAHRYELTERMPDATTVNMMQKLATKHRMVIVSPVYEEPMPGVSFNIAAEIDGQVVVVSESIETKKPGRVRMRARQRFFRVMKDREIGSA
jgi:predicted amidohydrolase